MRKIDPELLQDAADRAMRYLGDLPERRVAADLAAVERLRRARGCALPEHPSPPDRVLDELDTLASAATVATGGPRYFGFVTGGALPACVAASWLAGAWDQNAFNATSSPAGVGLEEIAEAWLIDLLGLPEGCGSSFTTGASLANLTALAAARHATLAAVDWNVEEEGLWGAPEIRVFVSAEQHPTVHKALGLLGLGRERVERLPVDDQGRIDASALPRIDGPAIVCAQAGNVNSGASDPFPTLADWCKDANAWLHVDGAFGLWLAASRRHREALRGVERADSWATDGHKWLNVPYDSGIAFVRDPHALRSAMAFSAAYLPEEGLREPFHYNIEASRRARGIEVWAALRSLGRSGVEDLVDRCCRMARRFSRELSRAGHTVLNDVAANQVVVAFGDADQNRRVIEIIQAEGVCWCGPTHWRGRDAMRISVSNWGTGEEDVDRSLASILAAADTALAGDRD